MRSKRTGGSVQSVYFGHLSSVGGAADSLRNRLRSSWIRSAWAVCPNCRRTDSKVYNTLYSRGRGAWPVSGTPRRAWDRGLECQLAKVQRRAKCIRVLLHGLLETAFGVLE